MDERRCHPGGASKAETNGRLQTAQQVVLAAADRYDMQSTAMTKRTLTHSLDDADRDRAQALAVWLAATLRNGGRVGLAAPGEDGGPANPLPAAAAALLRDALEIMARGDAVRLAPQRADLTLREAADLLGLTRTRLDRLLDEGTIAHSRRGARRRVSIDGAMAWRDADERRQRAALDALALHDQEIGLERG
ncbi:MAG: helix-turn-helix domain-containing protein [Alphaproteobacteria bacterium]